VVGAAEAAEVVVVEVAVGAVVVGAGEAASPPW